MQYPRIKKFNFTIDSSYIVKSNEVGRLDMISFNIYGNINMYKPLANANNIILQHGYRVGIRRLDESIKNELILKGFSSDDLDIEYNRIIDNKRLHSLDWYYYTDSSSGIVSDVYEGRVLVVPTFESANKWLNEFEFLEN
jgi:hypothetical protein